MKRLRDSDAATPLMQRAQTLLASVEPLADDEMRKERVRRRLAQPRPRAGLLRRFPALGTALAIALFGASAFAAVRLTLQRVSEPATEPAKAPAKPRQAQPPPREPQRVALPPLSDEAPAEEVPAQTPPVSTEEPRRPPKPTRALQPSQPAVEEAAPAPRDSALVHRAVQALRREGDAGLAARLLAQHRKRNPAGPLAEEVLSLQVEAALALGDRRARAFANQYLARYPQGRYASIARRALSDAQP